MTEITDRDPAEMDHDELRAEWEECWERDISGQPLDDEEQERVWDRRQELWHEMRDRVAVEMPECPECGGQSWSQNAGDPKRCSDCGLELGMQHEDLVEQIDRAWQQITAGQEESA